MNPDLQLTLAALEAEQTPITRTLLLNLCSLSRADSRSFAATLARLSPQRRSEILRAMAAYAEESFEADFDAIYCELLTHQDPVARGYAVDGLWENESVRVLDALLRMLAAEQDVTVRAKVAAALGHFVFMAEGDELDQARATALRQGLETALESAREDIEVQRRALESLAYINDDAIRRMIDRAYTHADARMRESALYAMGRSADDFWTENVLAELGSKTLAMVQQAVRASGEIRLKRAVPLLIELLAEPDLEMQKGIVWALGQIGTRPAVRALEALLENETEELSEAIDEALSEAQLGEVELDLLVHSYADAEADAGTDREPAADDADDADDEDGDDEPEGEWPDNYLDLN